MDLYIDIYNFLIILHILKLKNFILGLYFSLFLHFDFGTYSLKQMNIYTNAVFHSRVLSKCIILKCYSQNNIVVQNQLNVKFF